MPGQRADGTTPTAEERGKARAVLNRLRHRYPEIGTALDYDNPWQLLVVTILSAQTTDENVNKVAPSLFARYPEPDDLADADREEVEVIVYSTGFYRQKSEAIIRMSQDIVDRHEGQVPRDIDQLVELRGVGRKTASVVLAEAWDLPAVAVDTHVRRVTRRLGLTTEEDPAKIEADLRALYPKKAWSSLSVRFIQFGRDICQARKPLCGACELFTVCEWPGRFSRAGKTGD